MQQFLFATGDTSQTIDVFLPDSSSTTGGGLTGLVFNTASLTCYYRKGATGTPTAVTLATQTVGGAWSSGGFVAADGTNQPGMYRFDIPDTVLAAAGKSTLYFRGATNLAPTPVQIQIDAPVALDMAQALPAAPVANTIGEALFIADNLVGRINTAQAGAASTITLDASASATDGRYIGYGVYLYGGTGGGVRGVGQERTIVAYNGTTKVATVAQAWGTNPDNTSKFMLYVNPFTNVGIWNGTVVATPATAGVPDMNAKNINNVATTSVTTINANLGATQPVNFTGTGASALVKGDAIDWNSVAVTGMPMPTYTPLTAAQIATGVWQDTTAGDFTTALSVGKSLMNGVALGTGLTVARCTLTDTLTTYTGNTVQTGDAFARVGAAGAGLTALGDTRIANLDATVSSRGTSTLTQTQVTGGAYALNNSSFAFAATLDFTTAQKAATLARVTLVDTTTTNTDMRGTNNAALAATALSTAVWTAPPTGFLTTAFGATVGTSTYAGADTAGTTTLLTRVGTPAGASLAADIAALFTTAMTESYNADGSPPTPAQALMLIMQRLTEFAISGTTITVKRLNGSTTAATLTLDSATAPTSSTRAS